MLEEYFKEILNSIDSIVIYKSISEDKIIKLIKKLCTGEDSFDTFSRIVNELSSASEKKGYSGNVMKKYIIDLFLTNENTFSIMCEKGINAKNSSLYRLALNDIKIMLRLADFDMSAVESCSNASYEIMDYKPVNVKESEILSHICSISEPEKVFDEFIKFYNTFGCGNIAVYRSFRFNDEKCVLEPIIKPDPITFDDIVGYEEQRKMLINNTLAFINDIPANNVLLTGARGTGKSSSVKALVNTYYDKGLRIIEVSKNQLTAVPELLSMLKNRGKYFIIFIDDLSFDEQEIEYKYMKSLLEGGSESKPDNVLFYATSNRKNLVQEKWSDRRSDSDDAEIRTTDTMNEKLSLSDRFGLTITYAKPTPNEYMDMVKSLAVKYKIPISDELLKQEAMKWELRQKGRSGRTAKQFINYILWEINSAD